MSEQNDEISEQETSVRQSDQSASFANQGGRSSEPRQDLVDTFDFFKTYSDHKDSDLKSDILLEK